MSFDDDEDVRYLTRLTRAEVVCVWVAAIGGLVLVGSLVWWMVG